MCEQDFKLLEEPPEKTLFLLIAENTEHILPTILSRTQIFKVPRISHTDLSAALMQLHGQELSHADLAAHMAEGNWLKALEHISTNKDMSIHEFFVECMRISYKKDVISMLNWANKMAAQTKEQQKTFLLYALHIFRQSLLYNYTGKKLVRVTEQERGFISNFSPFITGNNIKGLYDAFSDSHYHIQRNANQKLLFTDLVFNTMKMIHKG